MPSSITDLIPFHRPLLGAEEADAVAEALAEGRLMGNGPVGRRAEAELRRLLDVPFALLTSSCTSAIELALMVLGIGPGDEVLLPSFTFVSCATAVARSGGRPVFVDIDPVTLAIDPAGAERAITPKTRAILAVHYGGFPCGLEGLLALARRQGLALIEDAAQAFGSRWRGRALGTIGDLGCLSFHATKNLTCGEGGALLTTREDLARRAGLMREKGTNREAFLQREVDRYTWVEGGGSFVLSDLLAAVLLAQLGRSERIRQERERIARRYLEGLAGLEQTGRLQLPRIDDASTVNWHTFYLLVPTPERRDRMLRELREAGIEACFHFVPLHSSPYAQRVYGCRPDDLPVTEDIARRLIRLPIYPGLPEDAQEHIVSAVRRLLGAG